MANNRLVVELAVAVVPVVVATLVAYPEIKQVAVMRYSLAIKRFSDTQIDFWQRVSSNAATTYHRATF